MKYRVLKPEFEKTGEQMPDGRPIYRVKQWIELGLATSMQHAKRLHPTPVLVPVTAH